MIRIQGTILLVKSFIMLRLLSYPTFYHILIIYLQYLLYFIYMKFIAVYN